MDKASKHAQAATCSLNTMKKRYAARAAAYLSLGAALTAVYSFSGLGLGAAALVLGVLAVIKAAKHLGTAQGTRAYTELPLAVSIIALFATVAMVGLGAWSILH